jgi:hypothetical protein
VYVSCHFNFQVLLDHLVMTHELIGGALMT